MLIYSWFLKGRCLFETGRLFTLGTSKEGASSRLGAYLLLVPQRKASKLFPCKNANTKWCPVRQTCKSMNCSRRKRAAACFLTAVGPVVTKKADQKTIMNYHTRGQRRKTIIDYHEEFEQVQTAKLANVILNLLLK